MMQTPIQCLKQFVNAVETGALQTDHEERLENLMQQSREFFKPQSTLNVRLTQVINKMARGLIMSAEDIYTMKEFQATLVAQEERITTLERLDSEASTHVESQIAMLPRFTGEEPYVGWKGLGLALKEELEAKSKALEMANLFLPDREIPELGITVKQYIENLAKS